MSLTRFLGATSREALRRVREALGADAMIVSNREVDGGVEIVATNDDAAAAAVTPEPVRRAPIGLTHPAPQAVSAAERSIAPRPTDGGAGRMPTVTSAAPPAVPAERAPALRQDVLPDDRSGPDDALPAFRVPGVPPRMRAPALAEPVARARAAGLDPATPASIPAAAASSAGISPITDSTPPRAPDASVAEPAVRSAPVVPALAHAAARMPSVPPSVKADLPASPTPVAAAIAAEPPALLRAIDALQDSLGERIDGLMWRQQAPESPVGLAVYRTLLGAGFSAALARALATRVPARATREDALAWVRHELAKRLPVHTDEAAMFAVGGVFALVGPTGVGKTTTTAKLAARWVLAHGADRVAMLTTDGFRVGAHEQLRIYGRILGVPVLAVGDSEQLQHALRELKDKHVVLIDTVGMSQRDRNLAEQAALLCAAGRPVRRLLLLNAASHGDTLDEVAHAYRQDAAGGLSGCILTKVDEAPQLGAALDIAIRHRLPIHYVSDGQKVPENAALPNAPALVERALDSAARALFAPTEADLAAVWNQAGQAVAVAPDARQVARRQRDLQAALGGLGAQAQPNAQQALSRLAADRTTVLARQVWRGFQDDGEAAGLADLMLADVRVHAAQAGAGHLLAWHGRARTAPVAGNQRAFPGSVLWSEQGTPLAAPARHLVTANGVIATFSAQALPAAGGAESATARAVWLQDAMADVRLVHGFDGFSVTQMQAWQAQGFAWFARCTGTQRVQWEDARITVGALTKLLGYAPAGEVRVGEVACTCWVAGAAVGVAVPGQGITALQLVSMRCVDAQGKLCAQSWALTHIPSDGVETARVGRWLCLADAARRTEPWLQTAIEACVRPEADMPTLTRGLLAGAQLGLSAWHLAQGEGSAGDALGLPRGIGPKARRQVLDQVVRVFGALDMHEQAPATC